jgi:hypothetical protein
MYSGVPQSVPEVSSRASLRYFEKPKSAILISNGTWVKSIWERNSILFASLAF